MINQPKSTKNEVSDITLAITTSESFETKFLLYQFVTILRSFPVHPLNCTKILTGEFIITSWEFIVSGCSDGACPFNHRYRGTQRGRRAEGPRLTGACLCQPIPNRSFLATSFDGGITAR